MNKNNNTSVRIHYTEYEDTNDAFLMTEDGCGFVRVFSWKKDNIAQISDLSVNSSKRKKGIGNLLLGRAEDIAKVHFGVDFIQLKVENDSWMEEWYKRHGYEFISAEENSNYVWMMKKIKH